MLGPPLHGGRDDQGSILSEFVLGATRALSLPSSARRRARQAMISVYAKGYHSKAFPSVLWVTSRPDRDTRLLQTIACS